MELNLEHGSHERVYICEYVYVCAAIKVFILTICLHIVVPEDQ